MSLDTIMYDGAHSPPPTEAQPSDAGRRLSDDAPASRDRMMHLSSVVVVAQSVCGLARGIYAGIYLGQKFYFIVQSDGSRYGMHRPEGIPEWLFRARLYERLQQTDAVHLRLMA
jgi:hypothetical protein